MSTRRCPRSRRLRSTRRRQHRRQYKQTGGEKDDILFTLEDKEARELIDLDDVKSLKVNKKYDLTMFVEDENGDRISYCTLTFSFNRVGELALLHCMDYKLEPYKIKSYLIIGLFLQILKDSHDIRTVYLMPVSDPKKGFMKLYNFYKNMGFMCIGEFRELDKFIAMNTNDKRISFLSKRKSRSNSLLKAYTEKAELTNADISSFMMTDCFFMAGDVNHILETIQDKISTWRAENNSGGAAAAGAGAGASP